MDWKTDISKMLEEVLHAFALPEGSLYLIDNQAQKENTKTISYTVCIWEPSYPLLKGEVPTQNKIITTIIPSTAKGRPDDLDVLIREKQEKDLHEFVPDDAVVLKQTKTDKLTATVKVRFNNKSNSLVEYIQRNTEYCIKNYVSKAPGFACCSKYEECSDAKVCLHKNMLYSKACMYRSNLESGKIFYGKNKNI